jgi:hypothetical protein
MLVGSTDANSGRYWSHQQYLSEHKNLYGYCPDHGTGVSCPIGAVKASDGPLGPSPPIDHAAFRAGAVRCLTRRGV